MCLGSEHCKYPLPGIQYKLINPLRTSTRFTMEVAVAVLTVDLASGPSEISGLGSCRKAHILFMYRDQPICRREVDVVGGTITRSELVMAMKEQEAGGRAPQRAWDAWAAAVLNDHLGTDSEDRSKALPPCTVLICTRDRPTDLRRCLSALSFECLGGC